MPPKQQKTKGDKKKAQKAADDKTFGMKNKNKSAKVQRYVQQVTHQAQHNASQTDKEKAKAKAKEELAAKKAAEAKRKLELEELFKPVQVPQKVPFGTDPKSVICQYFKAGHCERGAKCKFSHDLNIERKSQKKDVYTDAREDKTNDTMESWDQKKLEEVVQSKAGKQPPTDIVCKYFLEAIESNKYGWFWECPNGGVNCKYRHALPPGFVLKSKKAKTDDKQEISLEEFLDTERHKLGPNLTPVTLESFNQWKKNRVAKKDAAEAADRKAKENRVKAGRSQGMSGRDLFDFNPDLALDEDEDDDALDLSMYERKDSDDEEESIAPSASSDINNGVANISLNNAATKA
ncbi:hypothetical protein BDB00DRAFT_797374 [Zychaea mexicana]|uniref:uncharacterized protein n=1 Tax=Zychaea mexicana TaxID=64656 RepID=UPI0022FDDDFE|nr:uncharacterized protein BDB00DRAFT_797374 [Zychaea mexicana]KAI9498933.1 hypothetical protein BDB00DRAFT_797374 [Zychaea mexicana]